MNLSSLRGRAVLGTFWTQRPTASVLGVCGSIGCLRMPILHSGRLLRNPALACRDFHPRLRGKPQGCDRGHRRGGPRGRLRAGTHDRAELVEW